MKLDPFHVGGIPHVSLQVVDSYENAAFIGEKDNCIFSCAVGDLLQEPYCLVESQGFALTGPCFERVPARLIPPAGGKRDRASQGVIGSIRVEAVNEMVI